MYAVDSKDQVVELTDFPQSSVGSPCPMVLADEHRLFIAYYLESNQPRWDKTRILNPSEEGDPVAIVAFPLYAAMMFGPPNDEAFSGHPLAARGLQPYSVFEVKGSSWIRGLERMNSVHPYHQPAAYKGLRHFILAFHDSTFECVAKAYELEILVGSLNEAMERMRAKLAE
jgi:hypothetical protein